MEQQSPKLPTTMIVLSNLIEVFAEVTTPSSHWCLFLIHSIVGTFFTTTNFHYIMGYYYIIHKFVNLFVRKKKNDKKIIRSLSITLCFGFVKVLTKELPASKAQMFSIERDVQAEIYLVFRFVQNIKSVFFLLLCVKKILFLFAPQALLTGCFLVDIDMIAIVLCTLSLFFQLEDCKRHKETFFLLKSTTTFATVEGLYVNANLWSPPPSHSPFYVNWK